MQPGEPLWRSSNNRLQGLTRVEPTVTSFQLPTWEDTPNNNKILVRGKLIGKVLTEMQAQMKAVKEDVIAAEASKQSTRGQAAKNSHRDIKDSGKPPKLKLKPAAQGSQDDQSAETGFPSDNLNGAFEALMDPDNQEISKPSNPSLNKPAEEALKPVNLAVNTSLQEAQQPGSFNVSQSPPALDTFYGNTSIHL